MPSMNKVGISFCHWPINEWGPQNLRDSNKPLRSLSYTEFTTVMVLCMSAFKLPEINVHVLVTNLHVWGLLYLTLSLYSCFNDSSFEEENNHRSTTLADDSSSRSFSVKIKERAFLHNLCPYARRLLFLPNQNWLSGN